MRIFNPAGLWPETRCETQSPPTNLPWPSDCLKVSCSAAPGIFTKDVCIRDDPWFNFIVNSNTDAISRLCPACGLCCNGVLFGDVELQRGDDAKVLTKLGIDLFRKGRKTAFSQPCSCFDGERCNIYAHRPEQCCAFECGLLKRVKAGRLTPGAALKTIAETRRNSAAVLELVRKLGNLDEHQPLNQRYARVAAQPIDLSADVVEVERRGELMMAVARLVKSLKRDFLT